MKDSRSPWRWPMKFVWGVFFLAAATVWPTAAPAVAAQAERLQAGEQTPPPSSEPEPIVATTVTWKEGDCNTDAFDNLLVGPGATVRFCYAVTNAGEATLYGIELTGQLTLLSNADGAGDLQDDIEAAFPVDLSGLSNEDGGDVADDLRPGETATGQATVQLPDDYCGFTIQTATATGHNGRSGANYVYYSVTDTARTECTIPLAVTVGYVHAQRTGDRVDFTWQTVAETGTAGFDILAESDGQLIRLNDEMIASPAVDSVTPQFYRFSATTAADVYYLDEIDLHGAVSRMGSYRVGVEYGAWTAAEPLADAIYLPLIRH